MFLNGASGYRRDGTQFARGKFLILASTDRDRFHGPPTDPRQFQRIYAAVRTVTMESFGNWMMGRARVAGTTVTLSGAYGSDGLPLDFDKMPAHVQAKFIPLTDKESLAYWNGEGGWNSTGTERDAMRRIGLAMLNGDRKPRLETEGGNTGSDV